MDKIKIHSDKLPPRYSSWLDLWNQCKDQIKQHDAIFISFLDGENRYETNLEFIKARCFEEFTESYAKFIKQVNDFMHPKLITLEIGSILEGKSYFIKPNQHESTNN